MGGSASIDSARTMSRTLLELAGSQFGEAYWHPSFIPFLEKINGDNLYVDVDGIHGPPGSVVDFDHERPDVRRVLYDSVAQWLECLVEGLALGLYEWADAVFPRDFLDDGDLYEIRTHDRIYTNGAYPWERRLALRDE